MKRKRINFANLTNKRKEEVIAFGVKRKWTYKDFEKHYKRPSWCNYQDALFGMMGCYWLLGFGEETKNYRKRKCDTCDNSLHLNEKKLDEIMRRA